MRPSPGQQVITAMIVLAVVLMTVVLGAVMALSDSRREGAAALPSFAAPVSGITAALSATATSLKPTAPTQGVSATPSATLYVTEAGESAPAATASNLRPIVATLSVTAIPEASLPGSLPEAAAPTTGPTATQTSTDGACSNPDSRITSPPVGAVLRDVVEFIGTARLPEGFDYYKFEIRPDRVSTAADFVTINTWHTPVTNGTLMQLDTRAFPNGGYWIRLVVADTTGNYPERCSNFYTIRN
ncbi:MAG: hypothetical protein IT326_00085 [Anaerolineae bacterium]|nr:hypothetical protein [Anaerolineae bacterium]